MPETPNTRADLSGFIEGKLEGAAKQTLLDFLAWCKAGKMPVRLSLGCLWGVHFKSKRVATIEITVKGARRGQYTHEDNAWLIGFYYIQYASPDFEAFAKSEKISETVWDNVAHCKESLKACYGSKPPGVERKIAGKIFNKICVGCGGVAFKNPGAETLECVKKLVEFRKKSILAEGK
jgi:hypothetical protein